MICRGAYRCRGGVLDGLGPFPAPGDGAQGSVEELFFKEPGERSENAKEHSLTACRGAALLPLQPAL